MLALAKMMLAITLNLRVTFPQFCSSVFEGTIISNTPVFSAELHLFTLCKFGENKQKNTLSSFLSHSHWRDIIFIVSHAGLC